jgi:hypothetical protein
VARYTTEPSRAGSVRLASRFEARPNQLTRGLRRANPRRPESRRKPTWLSRCATRSVDASSPAFCSCTPPQRRHWPPAPNGPVQASSSAQPPTAAAASSHQRSSAVLRSGRPVLPSPIQQCPAARQRPPRHVSRPSATSSAPAPTAALGGGRSGGALPRSPGRATRRQEVRNRSADYSLQPIGLLYYAW